MCLSSRVSLTDAAFLRAVALISDAFSLEIIGNRSQPQRTFSGTVRNRRTEIHRVRSERGNAERDIIRIDSEGGGARKASHEERVLAAKVRPTILNWELKICDSLLKRFCMTSSQIQRKILQTLNILRITKKCRLNSSNKRIRIRLYLSDKQRTKSKAKFLGDDNETFDI